MILARFIIQLDCSCSSTDPETIHQSHNTMPLVIVRNRPGGLYTDMFSTGFSAKTSISPHITTTAVIASSTKIPMQDRSTTSFSFPIYPIDGHCLWDRQDPLKVCLSASWHHAISTLANASYGANSKSSPHTRFDIGDDKHVRT